MMTAQSVGSAIRRAGYRPLYSSGTRCPGCGASAWTIGRVSAECARCGTALPLAPEARQGR